MTDKEIFAENLNMYMRINGKSRRDIENDLGYSYFTITDWVKGKKIPRWDKVRDLAQYFGIKPSDLVEERITPIIEEKGDTAVDITIRLGGDEVFREVVKRNFNDKEFLELSKELCQLNTEQIVNLRGTLRSLLK